jgi:hypothetical protein
MKALVAGFALVAIVLLSGCSSYITPGGRADFSSFTSATPSAPDGSASDSRGGYPSSRMQESFAAQPTARFPVGIAFVRVQAPQYYSYYADQTGSVWGEGRYSIITTREVGEEDALARIGALPQVQGITGLNRMLLPTHLDSDRELREAAARVKAEMLVLYTFDTSFHDQNKSIPLTTISLGTTLTKRISVHVTASALVLDTRTGFIYATFEASEQRQVDASLWSERRKADSARQEAEQAAFRKLTDEFVRDWHLIVDRAAQGA